MENTMYNTVRLIIIAALTIFLSGCLLAAAGAGAGAMYVKDNYKISVKKKNESSEKKTTKSEAQK